MMGFFVVLLSSPFYLIQNFLLVSRLPSYKMGILDSLSSSKPVYLATHNHPPISTTIPPNSHIFFGKRCILAAAKNPISARAQQSSKAITILIGAAGLTFVSLAGPSSALESPIFSEPSNALSLPTWAVHVSSVVEWATAMALVWQYGEKSGYESWKGLSWGMVPLLGGALCACTWHFFYNSESLEVLVALQAALTVIGNVTMCIAAYRIYNSSQERSNNS